MWPSRRATSRRSSRRPRFPSHSPLSKLPLSYRSLGARDHWCSPRPLASVPAGRPPSTESRRVAERWVRPILRVSKGRGVGAESRSRKTAVFCNLALWRRRRPLQEPWLAPNSSRRCVRGQARFGALRQARAISARRGWLERNSSPPFHRDVEGCLLRGAGRERERARRTAGERRRCFVQQACAAGGPKRIHRAHHAARVVRRRVRNVTLLAASPWVYSPGFIPPAGATALELAHTGDATGGRLRAGAAADRSRHRLGRP